jgi:hypothetical protein
MVRNYPQQLTATTSDWETQGTRGTETFANRAISRFGQLLCALRGHDSVLHFEGNRVMMRCTSCGYDSPGWEVSGRRPRQSYEGDERRHRMNPRRLVLRKTA